MRKEVTDMITKTEINRFVNRMKNSGVYVAISEKAAGPIKMTTLESLVSTLISFKQPPKINNFLFINERNRPQELINDRGVWLKKGEKVIINLFYAATTEKIKLQLEELREKIRTEKEKGEERIIEPTKETQEVSEKIREAPPVKPTDIKFQPIKLRNGLEILFPEMEGIKIRPIPGSPWIELEREDGEIFDIWQLNARSSKITISKRDCRIAGDVLIDINNNRIPLKRKPDGTILIDLTNYKEILRWAGII